MRAILKAGPKGVSNADLAKALAKDLENEGVHKTPAQVMGGVRGHMPELDVMLQAFGLGHVETQGDKNIMRLHDGQKGLLLCAQVWVDEFFTEDDKRCEYNKQFQVTGDGKTLKAKK